MATNIAAPRLSLTVESIYHDLLYVEILENPSRSNKPDLRFTAFTKLTTYRLLASQPSTI